MPFGATQLAHNNCDPPSPPNIPKKILEKEFKETQQQLNF